MWQCLIATAKLPSITLYLWTGVELVNTINGGRFDRAARAFKVQLAVSEAGPWTEVLDEELEDPRRKTAPLPLQTFSFPLTEARYIRFLLLSWYGYGSGGLQYFAPVLTFLGMSLVPTCHSTSLVTAGGRTIEVCSSRGNSVQYKEVDPALGLTVESADKIKESQTSSLVIVFAFFF